MTQCGVVGVGKLGRIHAQKYRDLENAKLVGVYDTDRERAEHVAGEFGVVCYDSAEELAQDVEAVTIAASTSSHFELARLFFNYNVHVNMEKPLAESSEQAAELCRLAEQKNLKLQVGHVERFNPALLAAREKLHRPLFIECHRLAPFTPRSSDVDVVLDLMIHDLDVILSLVQGEPVSVSAVGTPVLTSKIDIANARIVFDSGAVANVTSSRVSQNTQRKFRVFQPSQYLSIDFGGGKVNLTTKTGEWNEGTLPLETESWSLEKGDALMTEAREFIDSVQNDTSCMVSGSDGLMALKLAEQIIDGIKQHPA